MSGTDGLGWPNGPTVRYDARPALEDLARGHGDDASDAMAQLLEVSDAAAELIQALILTDYFERIPESFGKVGYWVRGVRLTNASCAAAERLFQALPEGGGL